MITGIRGVDSYTALRITMVNTNGLFVEQVGEGVVEFSAVPIFEGVLVRLDWTLYLQRS